MRPRSLLTGFPSWQNSWIVSHEKKHTVKCWNAAWQASSPARVWIS